MSLFTNIFHSFLSTSLEANITIQIIRFWLCMQYFIFPHAILLDPLFAGIPSLSVCPQLHAVSYFFRHCMVNIPVFMTYLILLWSHLWTTDQISCRTHTKFCVKLGWHGTPQGTSWKSVRLSYCNSIKCCEYS